jgi:hypothetical protein
MNILDKKELTEFNDQLIIIFKSLKFKDRPLEVKGSGSLRSQEYVGDYDLFTLINGVSARDSYDEFYRILNEITNHENCYFIEMKIQSLAKQKLRFYPKDKFNFKQFNKHFNKQLDFIKIDIIARIHNIFVEISCIYKFNETTMTSEQYKHEINDDIKEYIKDNNYFKVLKRCFSLFKMNNDDQHLLYLTRIFNSSLGEMYSKFCNLETLKQLLKHYEDDDTKNKAILNLKDIKLPDNIYDIDTLIEKIKNDLNKESKPIYNEIKKKLK